MWLTIECSAHVTKTDSVPFLNPRIMICCDGDSAICKLLVFFRTIASGPVNTVDVSSCIKQLLPESGYVICPRILDYPSEKIEKVQRSAIKNDFSYHSSVTTMFKHLKWPLLKHRRSFLKLIMFFKILHGLVDISFSLTPLSTPTHGHNQRFVIHFARTDTYL